MTAKIADTSKNKCAICDTWLDLDTPFWRNKKSLCQKCANDASTALATFDVQKAIQNRAAKQAALKAQRLRQKEATAKKQIPVLSWRRNIRKYIKEIIAHIEKTLGVTFQCSSTQGDPVERWTGYCVPADETYPLLFNYYGDEHALVITNGRPLATIYIYSTEDVKLCDKRGNKHKLKPRQGFVGGQADQPTGEVVWSFRPVTTNIPLADPKNFDKVTTWFLEMAKKYELQKRVNEWNQRCWPGKK